jgi:hypothetical protein
MATLIAQRAANITRNLQQQKANFEKWSLSSVTQVDNFQKLVKQTNIESQGNFHMSQIS